MKYRSIALSLVAILSTSIDTEITIQSHARKQWHLDYLDIDLAHQSAEGDGIKVAVLDSGASPHPDLIQNLEDGTSFLPGSRDGRMDRDGHGTAMAGIIAASGKNQDSASGVAPKATVIPVKVLDGEKGGDNAALASGIGWAVQHGAKIINISSAGGPSSELRRAVMNAIENDVLVVASAGNRPEDSIVQFPAYIEGVLAVGATDQSGDQASISVDGDRLTLTAPGVNIVSTGLNGGYRTGTGTSASAAIVAGVAALVWSRYPALSASQVIYRLTATATDKGVKGHDPEYGYGVVNPVAALTADLPPLAGEVGTPEPGSSEASPALSGEAASTPGPNTREPNTGRRNTAMVVAAGGSALVIALSGDPALSAPTQPAKAGRPDLTT